MILQKNHSHSNNSASQLPAVCQAINACIIAGQYSIYLTDGWQTTDRHFLNSLETIISTNMGYLAPVITVVVATVLGLVGYVVLKDGELQPLQENQFWGPAARKATAAGKEDNSIQSFQINISEKVLTDLKTRLKLEVATLEERVADPLDGVGFTWGVHKKFLKKVQEHWLNKYDWRTREALLNKYPNFKTTISGIEIHFQHVKPQRKGKKGTRALLLLHGWPGSFVEYQKLIPQLVEPKDSDINFEVFVVNANKYRE